MLPVSFDSVCVRCYEQVYQSCFHNDNWQCFIIYVCQNLLMITHICTSVLSVCSICILQFKSIENYFANYYASCSSSYEHNHYYTNRLFLYLNLLSGVKNSRSDVYMPVDLSNRWRVDADKEHTMSTQTRTSYIGNYQKQWITKTRATYPTK